MGEGEAVGALGDFDFQAVVGGGEMLWMPFLALILSILPLSRMDLLSAGRKMVAVLPTGTVTSSWRMWPLWLRTRELRRPWGVWRL